MNRLKMGQNLYLIDLKQEIEGFRNFIGSWIYTGERTFIVDVGPSASINMLIGYLNDLGVDRVDFILLTHIHIDHAGGIGELTEHFPEAKVVCHERAVKHLLAPEKLWEATKKALGKIAIAYGEMKPVFEKKIIPSNEFHEEGFEAISTPGHAIHHVSYFYDKYLFAGEVGGVFHMVNDAIYQRPATPPKFYLEKAVESLDKLLKKGKKEICFGHFGMHNDSEEILLKHKEQMFLWKDVIADQMKQQSNKDALVDNCIKELLLADRLFMPYHQLDDDIKQRELFFVKNTIDGYIGYINSMTNSASTNPSSFQ